MTLEEAKKILEEEGFYVEKATRPCVLNGWFTKYESPEICEAVQVVCSAGYKVLMFETAFQARKERLKKEYEKNTKAPGSAENHIKGDLSENKSIEHCGEPISGSPMSAVEGAKLKWKDNQNTSENPALNESASQFNDALLDEQAKKIECLKNENAELLRMVERMKQDVKEVDSNLYAVNKENKRLDKKVLELLREKSNLEDQITVLNACKKHNDKIDRKQIKCLGKEIARLNGIIHDKNAILADVAEELRLTKIREKNLAELGLKYVGENEKLKEELADKVVDKIDAQALKSAESALAWKEKVIAEKDEVIADLGNELAAFKESYKRRIKEDSEHFEHIQKICNAGLQKWLIESEYLEKDKPFRFSQLPDLSEEEEKKLEHAKKIRVSSDNAEEGADLSGVIVICGKDFVKKFRENEESLSEFLKNIEDEAVESMSIESGHLGGNESFGQMEALKPSQRFKQAVCDARLELLYFIS